jgi:hypothetical protein
MSEEKEEQVKYVNRGHWELIDWEQLQVAATPQQLWDKMRQYFKTSDENPIVIPRTVINGRNAGTEVTERKIRPYSVKALCMHCGITEEYINDVLQGPDSEWKTVLKTGLMIVWTQIYEMGMLGEFSPIFAAKAIAMDKEDTGPQKVLIEYVGDLPPLAKSENEILENMKLENGKPRLIDVENSRSKNADLD